jgi:putative phosphoribosyl transferase
MVVLAIPNGGVPLAIEVAEMLHADLDIIVCRKLALPMISEGGLGAVADDGTFVVNDEVVERNGVKREMVEYEMEQVKANIRERKLLYTGNKVPARLIGKTAIIVDDGLASGITMKVAVESVMHRKPEKVAVAIPVASETGYNRVSEVAPVYTCAVVSTKQFYLADFYRNWRDLSEQEVLHSLKLWRQRHNII